MKQNYSQSGQVLVIGLVALGFVLINTLVIIGAASLYKQNSSYTLEGLQALNLAEAGVDKAIASLNKSTGAYTGENETFTGPGSFSVSITSPDAGTKVITATGYVPSKAKPKAKRTIKINAQKGTGVSFRYGVQVGDGGLHLGSSNQINGSVYSNGSILGVNNNTITGDAWVAGGTQPNPDQSTDCSGINCSDFVFGANVSGENRFDVAQGFKQSSSGIVNKVSLKLKKTGSPPDPTIRILADRNGNPDKNTVLATGTLPSSLITSSYSWIDVTFAESPNLTANTQYWILVDTSSSSGTSFSWQKDSSQSYFAGKPVFTNDWQSGSAIWTNVLGDLSFKTYSGGVATSIDGTGGMLIQGDAHANTLKNLNVQKGAYYQAVSNVTAASFHPNTPDPAPKSFPISDNNISDWQNQAAAHTYTGDISSCVSSLGPGKYVGNISFNTKCNVTIYSPVWITGNFDLKNTNTLTLAADYGSTSGVIIVDGVTTMGNGNKFQGNSQTGSNLMLLSTYDSSLHGGNPSVVISNTGNTTFIYSAKGVIQPGNSNNFTELTAWGIELFSSSTINYESGLASSFFSSGPSGSYSIIKGTYQVK